MDKLNLCFDGRILDGHLTRSGIFFVAKCIIQNLSKRNINLYLYFDKEQDNISDIINDLCLDIPRRNILYSCSDFSNIHSFLSPMLYIPEVINRFPNVSQYIVVYDIIPFLLSECFWCCDENTWFKQLINRLDKKVYYFPISEYTKQDFLKYFSDKLDSNKMEVIPLSTNQDYRPNNNVELLKIVKEKNHIPTDKKYLFSLCTLEPRKNLIRAVKTFIDFMKKNKINDFVYVLAGNAWNGFVEKLENEIPNYEKYRDKIIQTGYVDDSDLEILYSNAEWFIYTSEYEGFGMPPLEAMRCGCPVITSNNSSLPEVVGDAGIMIDFDSDEQHVEAYEQYYFNEKLRKENAQKGLERAKLFSWDKCVDVILNKMNEIEQKKENKPLVTIITPTYNLIKNGRKDFIIQNFESVHKQTYKNIEHIVIDGASDDGTLKLLEEYKNKGWIKYYSEQDRGIYDALNKGILKANGKYIVCLNSDDYYCNDKAVELEVSKLEENDADACYANALRIHRQNSFVMSEWKGELFNPILNLMPCHQTFMIKTDVMRELGLYDLNYRVSADNVFMFKMIQHNKIFVNIDVDIIHFRDGGFSNSVIPDEICKDFVSGFWKEYGQYHHFTKLDCSEAYGFGFLDMPRENAIELGCKIENYDWQKKYFRFLLNHIDKNCTQVVQQARPIQFQKTTKKIKLFGGVTIFKYKQNYKNRRWYLFCLPVFRIKQKNESKKKCYLFGIPVLKIVENKK